jgi:hypothetical protein
MTAAGSSNRRRADRPVWVSQVGSHRLPMFVRRSSIHNLGWPLARVQSCRSQSRLCVIVVNADVPGSSLIPAIVLSTIAAMCPEYFLLCRVSSMRG